MKEIETIKVKDIIPADYNPRKITDSELEKLRNSINEFGFVDPIIINLKNNHIVGGHQRFKVLVNDGVEELHILKLGNVGWAFVDKDIEVKDINNEKALNIALNKISGEWDTGKLDLLLDDLSVDGFDVSLTGFDVDLSSFENNEDDEDIGGDLYDFLEDENFGDDGSKTLTYEKGSNRDMLPMLWFPLRNHIRLSYDEYNELMEVYEKYVKMNNGSNKGFATYLIAGRV